MLYIVLYINTGYEREGSIDLPLRQRRGADAPEFALLLLARAGRQSKPVMGYYILYTPYYGKNILHILYY